MTDSVDISLPTGLWLAKLTPSTDPSELLAPGVEGMPAEWLPTPLSTSHGFGGVLSLDDVHLTYEDHPGSQSMPLPGDRIVIARTGRHVQIFGAVEVTGVLVGPSGGVRIGHRPIVKLNAPVSLRPQRPENCLLDALWDDLFGPPARDRRLLPLDTDAVALCFTAFGLSLEVLFSRASEGPMMVNPIEPWFLDEEIFSVEIDASLPLVRVTDGFTAQQAIQEALGSREPIRSIEVSPSPCGRDYLVTIRREDDVSFLIVQSMGMDESFRPHCGFHQSIAEAADRIVAIETDEAWMMLTLDASYREALAELDPDSADVALRTSAVSHLN